MKRLGLTSPALVHTGEENLHFALAAKLQLLSGVDLEQEDLTTRLGWLFAPTGVIV